MASTEKWYMQKGVRTPGQPRREVAQEFYTNVLELGEFARQRYLAECQAGTRTYVQQEIDDLDEQIAVIKAELSKFQ